MDSITFLYRVQQDAQLIGISQRSQVMTRLVASLEQPSLPQQIIQATLTQGPVYCAERASFSLLPAAASVSFSTSQQKAYNLARSSNPLAVITGPAGSGKTTIAYHLVQQAIQKGYRVLWLLDHGAVLDQLPLLSGYPYRLGSSATYTHWLEAQVKERLRQPQIDFLPIHHWPDRYLAHLRQPQRLEHWLQQVDTLSLEDLTQALAAEFPKLSLARRQLLALSLKEMKTLLEQQFVLSKHYARLSDTAIQQGLDALQRWPQGSIIGTLELLLADREVWQQSFDLVVVEAADQLTHATLILVANLGEKLVLLATVDGLTSITSQAGQPILPGLCRALLPAYTCTLTEQFRQHWDLAQMVYPILSNRRVVSGACSRPLLPLQLESPVLWYEIASEPISRPTEQGEDWYHPDQVHRLLDFLRERLQTSGLLLSEQVGILTFHNAQCAWLQEHCPPELKGIKIGTAIDWQGQQRRLMLVSCVRGQGVPLHHQRLALTRAQDYLILFGREADWQQPQSLLMYLLHHPRLQRLRSITFT